MHLKHAAVICVELLAAAVNQWRADLQHTLATYGLRDRFQAKGLHDGWQQMSVKFSSLSKTHHIRCMSLLLSSRVSVLLIKSRGVRYDTITSTIRS